MIIDMTFLFLSMTTTFTCMLLTYKLRPDCEITDVLLHQDSLIIQLFSAGRKKNVSFTLRNNLLLPVNI